MIASIFSTVLGMLSYSAVLCHGHLTWGAPSGRWGQAALLMWKGTMQVPTTYDRAGWAAFPTQGLPIYIERFQKLPVRRHKPVQKHLILLTGEGRIRASRHDLSVALLPLSRSRIL